ncbi:MAG TPA: hypothetical protein VHR72_04470 [Gemmataceae bacterium]|jgi:hypothetical protein|nr:hypothetical protein [Gemmataceae bacterium]
MRARVLIALLLIAGPARAQEPTPAQVFEARLLPIFKSPNPSSCTQCHLAGVDLKNYLRSTHEQTFVALRDQGMIDLDVPEKSKILAFIRRGADDKGADLILQKNRSAEFEALKDWIVRSVRDPKLRALPAETAKAVSPPVEVIRHARTDHLVESYANTIWALRFRCMSCHIEGSDENRKLVEKHGPRVAWFKAGGPKESLEYLISKQDRLINVDDPAKSLLLQKPLAINVKHGGGKKMIVGDQGYRTFLAFLEDFARIKKGAYKSAESLPKSDVRARFGTDIWLKLTDTPPAWGDKLLLVDVYAWDAKAAAWERAPIASSDRVVWGGGKLWQHNLTLSAETGSERAKRWQERGPSLAAGKYLVKVYVDAAGRVAEQGAAAMLAAGEGEVESTWPTGYGRMTVLDARRVK